MVTHELASGALRLTHKVRAFRPTRLPPVSGKNNPVLRKLVPMESLQRNNYLNV